MEHALHEGRYPWSESYLVQPHVKEWLRSEDAKKWYSRQYGEETDEFLKVVRDYLAGSSKELPASRRFDLDVLLSLHSALMDGAQPEPNGRCGRIGEFKVCSAGHRGSIPRPLGSYRENLPWFAELTDYFAEIREGKPLSRDPVEFAVRIQRALNLRHHFRDGNGRTSKLLMNIALRAAGLPLPSIEHGFLDSDLPFARHVRSVYEALHRTVAVINGCSEYLSCAIESGAFKRGEWDKMCDGSRRVPKCEVLLPEVTLSLDARTERLDPCDCSLRWKYQKVSLSGCKE